MGTLTRPISDTLIPRPDRNGDALKAKRNELALAQRRLVESRDDARSALEFLQACRAQSRGHDETRGIDAAHRCAKLEANGECELYASAFERVERLAAEVAELEAEERGE
jgi:hypothetical protein